jgi:predicted nucleotidyltransferase component of viral defense system
MKDTIYYKQADLMLQVLPIIGREKDLALKGGTAINFFFRQLPRLSVDIDLCYLPVNERVLALNEISDALGRIAERIQKQIPGSRITEKKDKEKGRRRKLIINNQDVTVKIEPNTVLRGTIYPSETQELSSQAYKTFERYVSMQIMSFEDIYAGKICAALDRQHPRDFYDVKFLLENEGISNKLRQAFIIYLISQPRPIVEVLNPHLVDIQSIFENDFINMTVEPVTLDELLDTRTTLIKMIDNDLTVKERQFLLSFKKISPEWDLLDLPNIEKLPAVQWKLHNLKQMDPRKHKEAVEKLADFLKIQVAR